MTKPILISVAGASGSGKTTFCNELFDSMSNKGYKGAIISQDDFYYSADKIPLYNDFSNYDHPDSFDWSKINDTIFNIIACKETRIFKYDFTKSEPTKNYVTICNNLDFVIFEGLYTLYNQDINKLSSFKIFIDTELDECIIRRILRDTTNRGREINTVIHRWRNVVRPMYKLFVEPTKYNADIIVPWYDNKNNAINIIQESLIERIKNERN